MNYLYFLQKSTQRQREAERAVRERLRNLFAPVFAQFPEELSNARNRREIASRVEDEMLDLEEEYADILWEEGQPIAEYGANRTVHHLQAAGVSIAIGVIGSGVFDRLEEMTIETTQQTLARMSDDIVEYASQLVRDDLDESEIVERLNDKFNTMEQYETERIARTEMTSYNNMAAYETERELGVDFHQWITADDENVRGLEDWDTANHVIMHEQIVRVGEQFSNGLLYPGDKSGPLNEIINCRCWEIPFIIPEDYSAPPAQRYFYEDDLIEVV